MDKLRRFNLPALVTFTIIVVAFAACGAGAMPTDDVRTGGEAQAGSGPTGTETTPGEEAAPSVGESVVRSDSSETGATPSDGTAAEEGIAAEAHQSSTRAPAAAAEGTIAFRSDRDGEYEVYVMDAGGSGVGKPTDLGLFGERSPDERRSAFTSDRDEEGNLDVYVFYEGVPGFTRLTDDPGEDRFVEWSPDGQRIAFTSERDGQVDIYVMNADGSGVTRLTDDPGENRFGGWSPDGRRIAFDSDRDGNFDVYVINVDGSGVTRLTDDPGKDYVGGWSPDGRRIAFDSNRDGNFELYVINADGSGVTRLTDDPALDRFGGWSPDGRHIAFDSKRDGNFEVYAMNADGSGVTRLTDAPGRDRFVAWLSTHVARPTAELQEYAAALEEDFFYMENEVDDEVQAAADEIFSSAGFDLDTTFLLNALETSDSWSEDEARFANEYAETVLQVVAAAFDLILRGLNELVRGVSSLSPPEHLSGLHGNLIAAIEETIRSYGNLADSIENTDTEIKSREDLAEFEDFLSRMGVPEELDEQIAEACLELKGRLETELGREVSICN